MAFEKVSAMHPDKLADRIGGAILDLAYSKQEDPKVALEIMIGHGRCIIVNETNCHLNTSEIQPIIDRIVYPGIVLEYIEVPQDPHLAKNQAEMIKAGDNGISKAYPMTDEEKTLAKITEALDKKFGKDGKYILDNGTPNSTLNNKDLIVCQSNATEQEITDFLKTLNITKKNGYNIKVNPLGDWTGSIGVDCGCGNRKLGSDMGNSITGGGLHLKDLSKPDVSVNIYLWLKAQKENRILKAYWAIGDTQIHIMDNLVDYSEIVTISREYIKNLGGFEKFAEYGLIRACN
jgi:S-adenosylmethionine synthetase